MSKINSFAEGWMGLKKKKQTGRGDGPWDTKIFFHNETQKHLNKLLLLETKQMFLSLSPDMERTWLCDKCVYQEDIYYPECPAVVIPLLLPSH